MVLAPSGLWRIGRSVVKIYIDGGSKALRVWWTLFDGDGDEVFTKWRLMGRHGGSLGTKFWEREGYGI